MQHANPSESNVAPTTVVSPADVVSPAGPVVASAAPSSALRAHQTNDRPSDRQSDRPSDRSSDRPSDRPPDRPIHRSVPRVSHRVTTRPLARTVHRSLPEARKTTIAFLSLAGDHRMPNPAFGRLLTSVSQTASKLDIQFLYSTIQHPGPSPAQQLAPPILPPELDPSAIDGLLLHGDHDGIEIQQLCQGKPTVWLMANRRPAPCGDQITPNNLAIGELAVDFIAKRGHRVAAFLSLGDWSWAFDIRGVAFEHYAVSRGISATQIFSTPPRLVQGWGPDLVLAAHELVDRLLALSPRPTAVFLSDDRLVPAIEAGLEAAGLRTGPAADIELIACNHESSMTGFSRGLLAVIDTRPDRIGRCGVQQLLTRIRGENGPRVCIQTDPTLRLMSALSADGIQTNGQTVEQTGEQTVERSVGQTVGQSHGQTLADVSPGGSSAPHAVS